MNTRKKTVFKLFVLLGVVASISCYQSVDNESSHGSLSHEDGKKELAPITPIQSNNIEVIEINRGEDVYFIRAEMPSGKIYDNIRYTKRGGGGENGYWSLDIGTYFGPRFPKDEGIDRNFEGVSENDFIELLDALLTFIKLNYEGRLGNVRFEHKFVDSIWSQTISEIKNAAMESTGTISIVENEMGNSLTKVLSSSPVIERSCMVLARYDYVCTKEKFYSQHVFRYHLAGEPIRELANFPNAGLHQNSSLWITVLK